MPYEQELKVALEAAAEACRLIRGIYDQETYDVELKSDDSPVTTADRLANDLIVRRLAEAFPDYAILSEEGADDFSRRENDLIWMIDPLDGTREFIRRNGEFSVNIALVNQKRPVLGVICSPVTGERYSAVLGGGAFLETEDGRRHRLRVSDKIQDLTALRSRSRISPCLDKLYEEQGRISTVVRMGSSLKGCVIARGDAEIYYSMGHTMEWDTAAMEVIVTEAGGIFMQLDDTLMQYNRKDVKNRKGFLILNRLENKLDLEKKETIAECRNGSSLLRR